MRPWLVLAALVLAAPAPAQTVPNVRPTRAEEAALPYLRAATAAERAGDHAAEFAAADAALALLPDPTPFRGWVQCARGARLLAVDEAKGREALGECRRLLGDHPAAQGAYAQLLFHDNDLAGGTRLILATIGRDPRWATKCGPGGADDVRTWFRKLEYAGQLQLRAQLVEALTETACGREDPAFFSGLMREAILTRVQRGELDRARASLAAVIDPQDMLQVLADRRYATIWADAEKAAAGTLEPQRAALLYAVRASHAEQPSFESARRLAYALEATGDRAEAIRVLRAALADTSLRDPEFHARSSLAARLATLLHDAGETDVDVVTAGLRGLLVTPPGKGAEGLWNAVPNLALWLLNYGKPREALAVLDRYDASGVTLDAPAAHGYFAALRACARARSGDGGGAAALAAVARDYPTNSGAIRIAVMCGPDRAAQRALLIAELRDSQRGSATAVRLLRARAFGASRGVATFEEEAVARALQDPEVLRALDAAARDPGPGYRAALGKWDAR